MVLHYKLKVIILFHTFPLLVISREYFVDPVDYRFTSYPYAAPATIVVRQMDLYHVIRTSDVSVLTTEHSEIMETNMNNNVYHIETLSRFLGIASG